MLLLNWAHLTLHIVNETDTCIWMVMATGGPYGIQTGK